MSFPKCAPAAFWSFDPMLSEYIKHDAVKGWEWLLRYRSSNKYLIPNYKLFEARIVHINWDTLPLEGKAELEELAFLLP